MLSSAVGGPYRVEIAAGGILRQHCPQRKERARLPPRYDINLRKYIRCIQSGNASPPALPGWRFPVRTPWLRVLDASRPAASSTTRLTMEQSPPPDPAIVGWLTTLGVTSLCQWDILVFLYRHHTTLLGYTSHTILSALDGLESQELVARSRVSQGCVRDACNFSRLVMCPAKFTILLANYKSLSFNTLICGKAQKRLD
jgi:hypothetical protein